MLVSAAARDPLDRIFYRFLHCRLSSAGLFRRPDVPDHPVHLRPRKHQKMTTARTAKTDIGPRTEDDPLIGSAGVLFFRTDDISDMDFCHTHLFLCHVRRLDQTVYHPIIAYARRGASFLTIKSFFLHTSIQLLRYRSAAAEASGSPASGRPPPGGH